jgi:hypothetical protein
MLFLFIIRRLSPRGRAILGGSVILAGLAQLALAATVASWLIIHGTITTALGAAFCVAAYVGQRKARAAQEAPDPAHQASPVSG